MMPYTPVFVNTPEINTEMGLMQIVAPFIEAAMLKYIEDYGSITSLEAFADLGVTRLSAAIFNLRKSGHHIISVPEASTNRYGDTVRYARYRIAGK